MSAGSSRDADKSAHRAVFFLAVAQATAMIGNSIMIVDFGPHWTDAGA